MKKHILILLAFLFILPASYLQARGSSEEIIPDDPDIIKGVLDNGLSYYILENDYPEDRAILRLAVKAGSVLEDEDQRGLAHFVEHMAFNGTDKYSKNDLIAYLQSLGLEFGPDINAHTSFDETVYKLQVRTDLEEQLLTGLDVLNQWAFHLTLDPAEIEKERGVILEEWRLGRGARARMLDKAFPVLFKDSKYGERLPIGLTEVITGCSHESLTRFYSDWYRPDMMAVIAVGDFDGRKIEKIIKETFSPYSNPPVTREREEVTVPGHKETLFSIESDPEATSSMIEVLTKYKQERMRIPSDYRSKTAEMLFFNMLNSRLDELARSENPPFIQSFAYTTSYAKATDFSSIGAQTADGKLEQGLYAVLSEAERARRYGFSEGELERAKKELASRIERYYNERDNLESVYFAEDMVQAFMSGLPLPSIESEVDFYNRYLPEITMDDIEILAEHLLSRENRVVMVTAPEREGLELPGESSLSGIFTKVRNSEIAPYEDNFSSRELLQDIPAGSPVKERIFYETTEITQWTLENGITIVLKPTDFKKDEILFTSYSSGGTSLADDEDYLSALFASSIPSINGLGDFTAVDLEKQMAGKQAGVSPYFSDLKEGLSGSARPADLQTMFQLLYLTATEPRYDASTWDPFLGRVADSLANRDSDPRQQYSDLITSTMASDHFRTRPLRAERLSEVNQEKVLAFYKDRFSDFSDFTFFFTGNFSLEKIEPLISTYIGGLPVEEREETWIDRNIRYAEGVIKESLASGIEPVSMVSLIYTGDFAWSREELYKAMSLESYLQTQLTRVVREEASGVYGIGIRFTPARYPVEDYSFRFTFSCDPERTEELKEMVKGEISKIIRGEVDSKIVHDVMEAQLVTYSESLRKNSWWLSQMENVWYHGYDKETIINKKEMYGSLTAEDLTEVSEKYLSGKNLMEIILYPAE
ncbi:MAG: insulinase family protein [Spirochaetales bacterium]|nr:insulinase family protein [Spirochaetales bacterium]